MKLLLGINGYVGKKVWAGFYKNRIAATYMENLNYRNLDRHNLNNDVSRLEAYVTKNNIDTIVNCVGYVGRPNVDECEKNKDICYDLNFKLPVNLAKICNELDIVYCHIGTGCMYTGDNNGLGFSELDEPNFITDGSYYVKCKYQAEQEIKKYKHIYNLRIRMPFSKNMLCKRNLLNKIRNFKYILNARNTLCNIDEFVDNLIYCITNNVDFGTYNMCNHGSITTEEIVILLRSYGFLNKPVVNILEEEEFKEKVTRVPRSSCVLNSLKADSAGMHFKNVKQSIKDSLSYG